nr:ribonuclease H-like domain-containing protein [Tanacetum cinerariifolium]
MSTQQDIYAVGSENRPHMLNKENYVPWSSRLLLYAKSRPNGKLIHNSIINGSYVKRMIPEPAGFENRPPMLNKENYVLWSSRLLWYAKSRPNGKLIHNFIINSPYVRQMIPEPGDPNHEVLVNETFHVQIDDELTEKELKQIKADDQAIQTILLGLPEDIYAAVDSCETTQEIWLRVQQMMKGSDIGIQEKKAKLFNEWERFTSNVGDRLSLTIIVS